MSQFLTVIDRSPGAWFISGNGPPILHPGDCEVVYRSSVERRYGRYEATLLEFLAPAVSDGPAVKTDRASWPDRPRVLTACATCRATLAHVSFHEIHTPHQPSSHSMQTIFFRQHFDAVFFHAPSSTPVYNILSLDRQRGPALCAEAVPHFQDGGSSSAQLEPQGSTTTNSATLEGGEGGTSSNYRSRRSTQSIRPPAPHGAQAPEARLIQA
ncbi:hypothetical protein B0H11DRAFT_2221539 [Mycena galericulata]|nr:hypothetical protein B0H11DRAFT_2221539 [Mycena galericulata]